jgi:hypothetical protein
MSPFYWARRLATGLKVEKRCDVVLDGQWVGRGTGWPDGWLAGGLVGGRAGWPNGQERKTPMSPEAVRARTEIYGSPGSGWLMASKPIATRPETELRSSQVAS